MVGLWDVAPPTVGDLVGKIRLNDFCQYMTACFAMTWSTEC